MDTSIIQTPFGKWLRWWGTPFSTRVQQSWCLHEWELKLKVLFWLLWRI